MTYATELIPTDRQSFYNKAHFIQNGNATFLRSYQTIVAGVENGKIHRYWSGRTPTTTRHIKAFLFAIHSKMSIGDFYDLPISEKPENIY